MAPHQYFSLSHCDFALLIVCCYISLISLISGEDDGDDDDDDTHLSKLCRPMGNLLHIV